MFVDIICCQFLFVVRCCMYSVVNRTWCVVWSCLVCVLVVVRWALFVAACLLFVVCCSLLLFVV